MRAVSVLNYMVLQYVCKVNIGFAYDRWYIIIIIIEYPEVL